MEPRPARSRSSQCFLPTPKVTTCKRSSLGSPIDIASWQWALQPSEEGGGSVEERWAPEMGAPNSGPRLTSSSPGDLGSASAPLASSGGHSAHLRPLLCLENDQKVWGQGPPSSNRLSAHAHVCTHANTPFTHTPGPHEGSELQLEKH